MDKYKLIWSKYWLSRCLCISWQNIITYLLPNQKDILTKTGSASHEKLCSDAADIWDEEAAVGLGRDVRGSVVGELAVPVCPPFGQIVGWQLVIGGFYLPVSGLTL